MARMSAANANTRPSGPSRAAPVRGTSVTSVPGGETGAAPVALGTDVSKKISACFSGKSFGSTKTFSTEARKLVMEQGITTIG